MMLNATQIEQSLLIAIAGFTYSVILTQPGQIFAGLHEFLDRVLHPKTVTRNKYPDRFNSDDEDVYWVIPLPVWLFKLRHERPLFVKVVDFDWLFMPVIGCELCVSGQLSFWFFVWQHWNNYQVPEDMILHVEFVSLTIFIVQFIKLIYLWMKKMAN